MPILTLNVTKPSEKECLLLTLLFENNTGRVKFKAGVPYTLHIGKGQKIYAMVSDSLFYLSSLPNPAGKHSYQLVGSMHSSGTFGQIYLITREFQLFSNGSYQEAPTSIVLKAQSIDCYIDSEKMNYRLRIQEEFLCTQNMPYLKARNWFQEKSDFYFMMDFVNSIPQFLILDK